MKVVTLGTPCSPTLFERLQKCPRFTRCPLRMQISTTLLKSISVISLRALTFQPSNLHSRNVSRRHPSNNIKHLCAKVYLLQRYSELRINGNNLNVHTKEYHRLNPAATTVEEGTATWKNGDDPLPPDTKFIGYSTEEKNI